MQDDHTNVTNAQTDAESGNENLNDHEDAKKSLEALQKMYKAGLISEEEYNKRVGLLTRD